MTIIADYAQLFATSSKGVAQEMARFGAQMPSDPSLVPIWQAKLAFLGNKGQALSNVAALLFNAEADADLAAVQPQLSALQAATQRVHDDIGAIHEFNNVVDALTKFAALGLAIASFVAAPNPASAAALVPALKALEEAIAQHEQAESVPAGDASSET